MKISTFLIVCLASLSTFSVRAQEEESHNHSNSEHKEFYHHYIGLSIGHTHISGGVRDGETKWLALPSFGLSYVYAFNPKWAIGLHNEMIVEDFVVQSSRLEPSAIRSGSDEDVTTIKRGRPFAVAVVGIYKIHKHIGLLAGGGMEFSEHEDFTLVKIGAEFPYHFAPGWEMFGTLSADFKIDAYNSFSFGFGVAKLF